jgi:hypothetical protein
MNESYEKTGVEREPSSGMQRLLAFIERGIAAQDAVDEMTGPAVSVERVPTGAEREPSGPHGMPANDRELEAAVQNIIFEREQLNPHTERDVAAREAIALVRKADAPAPPVDIDALRTRVRRTIRSRDVGQLSAEEATEAILQLVAVFGPRVSHEGATVSELVDERFGPVGGER